MIKETIKYNDYDGNERIEDFYFNLTEAELTELELSKLGGLKKTIERVIQAQDQGALIQIFKELLLKSYGEKSPDGKHFVKTEELSKNFSYTEAYSQLFMALALDDEHAARFINGLPKAVGKKVN